MTASNVAMIDDFNPRSHEGSDDKRFYKKEFQHISIHAPTRGATQAAVPWICVSSVFQSTLPRGERHCSIDSREQGRRISIHAPTRGATNSGWSSFPFRYISIHAPTRGATIKFLWCQVRVIISIHAPTRGATEFFEAINKRVGISIHAPTRGATGSY